MTVTMANHPRDNEQKVEKVITMERTPFINNLDEKDVTQFSKEMKTSKISAFIPFLAYLELIKGKQTFLLVYTTLFAYLVSAWPSLINPPSLVWLLIAMVLAVSGTTMLNMYIDRDIDALMPRTRKRPIPSGRVHPRTVLIHGIILTMAGIVLAGVFVNLVTMIVIFLGFFFDVVIYSMWLKRRTKYSIIFGGIAGGLPAMAGRTAVLGHVDIIAILLLLFVLAWIPLHILSIALLPHAYSGYKIASIPMWPIVSGPIQTYRVIAISAVISAVTIFAAAWLLNIHLFAFIIIGIVSSLLIYLSIANLIYPSEKTTYRIFKGASAYMALALLMLFIGKIL